MAHENAYLPTSYFLPPTSYFIALTSASRSVPQLTAKKSNNEYTNSSITGSGWPGCRRVKRNGRRWRWHYYSACPGVYFRFLPVTGTRHFARPAIIAGWHTRRDELLQTGVYRYKSSSHYVRLLYNRRMAGQ